VYGTAGMAKRTQGNVERFMPNLKKRNNIQRPSGIKLSMKAIGHPLLFMTLPL